MHITRTRPNNSGQSSAIANILDRQRDITESLSTDNAHQQKQNFLDWCLINLHAHPKRFVTINEDRVFDVARRLEPRDPNNAFDFASNMTPEAADRSKAINPERVFFDLAMNIANQGGYIYVGPDGKAVKWMKDGIDVKAFDDLFAELFENDLLPGLPNSRIKIPEDVDKLMKPALIQENGEPVPFLSNRLQVFREFAKPDAWEKLAKILHEARQKDGSYHFDFKSIRNIAKIFPISFGKDAFLKKPALLPILFGNNANLRGEKVTIDGIVAADFRLPWTDHTTGMASFSDELVETLERKDILLPDDLMVCQMRSATIVISELMSLISGLPINEIDALKWMAMDIDNLKEFQDETVAAAKAQGRKITFEHMHTPAFSF